MLASPALPASQSFPGWLPLLVIIGWLVPEFGHGQFYMPLPIVPENKLAPLQALVREPSTSLHTRNQTLIDLANLYYNKPLKRYKDLDKAAVYARRVDATDGSGQSQALKQQAITLLALVAIDKNEFSRAEKLLEQLNGRLNVDLRLRLAYAYCEADKDFKQNDWSKAINLARQVVDSSANKHDVIREILGSQLIALVHAKQQDPSAENELLTIAERLKKAGSAYFPSTYAALSEYNYYLGDQSQALAYSLLAVKAMATTKNYSMAGDIYANHAMMWTDNDDHDKAVSFIQLAIKYYSQRAGRYNLSDPVFLFNTEYIYGKTSNYEEDLRTMKKLLASVPPQTISDHIYHDVIMGCIYRRMKKYERCEVYYKRAYAISKKHGLHLYRTTASLGQLYTDSKQFEKARPFLYEVLQFPKTLHDNSVNRHLHYMTFLTDSATGHYQEAIKQLSLASSMSYFNLTRSRESEVQRLRIAFEAQQKEDEINIKNQNIRLLNQNASIQEERLRNANLNMGMAGIIVLFLVVSSALIFSKYQQNRQNSQAIEQKNTIITEKNQILEHLLDEKEWLLKEVHHRVKNNLHTIFCLLESQGTFLGSDALKVLETSQHRIYAMSLIHQKLYQSDDITTVDMKSYLAEFLLFLAESFDHSDRIRIVQEIDSVKMPSTQAVPLALIINESVTNAFKHAFPGNLKGVIQVKLHQLDNKLLLTVEDNGIGWNESVYNYQKSLGIQLMKGLSEELGARIYFDNQEGTRISLVMNYKLKEEEKIQNGLFV
ncbi:histidine kinase dimerization/phosphoacceptor domain -containing protein [Spirosoma sp. KNUC1025]|uniref:histidine kinase dimerization/phosphoacceptor domain -containing protein n=1 Tax=Spirosoma sp. KNUC1025 TaxID=2894082 RepID=UPI001E5F318A|nr:histidine kinase dimerization/phosphoacceptor domain -containing protein [Spirosoma sp. KNUC1025]UFH57548.1 ATP-binding protein [Spirosoma sp. KNUC1025]